MFKTVSAPIAAGLGRARCARRFRLSLLACCAALAGPALAGQDYPTGLFENSPVVPHGSLPEDAAPTAPADPSASGPAEDGPPPDPYASGPADTAPPPDPSGPTNVARPPHPYASGPRNAGPPPYGYPPGPANAGPPPYGYQPPDDYCAGIAFRTFSNLAEVRRAHARCDPYLGPPPGY